MKNQTNLRTFSKIAFLSGVFSFSACNFSASVHSGNAIADNLEKVSSSDQKIRNQIQYEENGGLKVESAFLMLENGELLPESNATKAGDRIKLILKLSGWRQAENGKVQIGAGEQLVNSDQRLMMREDDLFANSNGVSEEDAGVITLIMEVTNTDNIYDFYQTDFKVWNKNADQHIYGSYRFKIVSN